MKKILATLTLIMSLLLGLTSCEKMGDNSIIGTFRYSNEYTGDMKIREVYEFKSGGSVFNKKEIGLTSSFDTKGCSLYYKLNGNQLTIYHGVKGWKKEVRHTPYAIGIYENETITIDDKVFYKQ